MIIIILSIVEMKLGEKSAKLKEILLHQRLNRLKLINWDKNKESINKELNHYNSRI